MVARFFLFVLFLGLGPLCRLAAQATEPVEVPVQLKVTCGYDPATFEYGPVPANTKVTASLADFSKAYTMPAALYEEFEPYENYRAPTKVEFVKLDLGVEYSLVLSRTQYAWAHSFTITPPPGFQILINGLARKTTSVDGSGTFKIRVLPALENQPSNAGTATEFMPGQVKWAVSLGAERNGEHLGYAWIVGQGTGTAADAWAPFLSPANLYCNKDKDADDLAIYRAGGLVRQIRANEAWIDVIQAGATGLPSTVPPVASPAAYEIRFYHPSSMQGSTNPRTPIANKQPFVVYRVIDESSATTKKLKIVKQVCALGDSATRNVVHSEYTTITREGVSADAFTWTATGWTFSEGETQPAAATTSSWSALPHGHRSVTKVQPYVNGILSTEALISTIDHVSPAASFLPRMIKETVVGPLAATDSMEARTAYYADLDANGNPVDAKRYRFGLPQLTTSGAAEPDGAALNGPWSAYAYIDPAAWTPAISSADRDKWLGAVAATFAPAKDTPSPSLGLNAEPGPGPGILATYYNYAKDAFGYPSRLTLTETYHGDKIPANLVAKSTIAYTGVTLNLSRSYQGVTITGVDCVKATRSDHSSAGNVVVSSRIYAKENEITSYLRDQNYSEVNIDGTQVSYSRRLGTFTPGTPMDDYTPLSFSSTATGPCNRIGIITGSSVAGPDTESAAYGADQGSDIVNIYLVPGRSTQTYVYRDKYARVIRVEKYIRSASASWVMVDWENNTYNLRNQLTKKTGPGGAIYEYYYNFEKIIPTPESSDAVIKYAAAGSEGEYLTREVDDRGVETHYTYDKAGRVVQKLRKSIALPGESTRFDLASTFVYDAADKLISESTSAVDVQGVAASLAVGITRTYDAAGRVTKEKSSGSPEVETTYDLTNRKVKTTNKGTGAYQVTESYRDGQVKSVAINNTPTQSYDYGFDADGSKWSFLTTGSSGSTRMAKTWTDWLGRNIKTETPPPPGTATAFTSQTFYASTTPEILDRGLPIKVVTSASTASAFTSYDSMSQVERTGLDADLSGLLEPDSAKDRITGTRTSIISEEGAWWSESESFTYATAGSDAEVILGKTRTRLTGFSGGLVAESESEDAEGNISRRTVTRDRATRTMVISSWTPGVASPTVETVTDGLTTSTLTPDGITIERRYDSLRRPIKTITPRTGASGTRETVTTYKLDGAQATTLVETVAEGVAPDLRTTTYSYDSAWRVNTVTNPDGKTTQQSFDDYNRVTHVFGTAASPVRYVYDGYGQRIEQHTFRDTTKTWYGSEADFPAPNDSRTDIVKWDYDPATGILLKKTDPLGRFVKYDYDAAGRIKTRSWARHKTPGVTVPPTDADRVKATVSYDDATGDLLSTTYNDGSTPPVSTTYDRLGRPLTISDAAGTRSFLRDSEKPWRTLAELLPTEHYGSGRALTWLYDEQTAAVGQTGLVRGRSRGFQVGTLADPDALLEQTTSYDSLGRLRAISAMRDGSGARQTFNYAYAANSRLLESVTAPGTGFAVTRTWDPVRDLLAKIETTVTNTAGVACYAKFEFTHTTLGQRHTSTQSGLAFRADDADTNELTTTYAYDDRGEVTQALTDLRPAGSALPAAGAAPIPGRRFVFGYDLAGNRLKSDHQGDLNRTDAIDYTVGRGNRLLARENHKASVSGMASLNGATTAVAVSIAADSTTVDNSGRQGRHWQTDLTLAEGSKLPAESAEQTTGRSVTDVSSDTGESPPLASTWEFPRKGRQITTAAGKAGAGVGGADLAAFDRVNLWLAPRDEQLRYDRDGNLLRDGTWAYTWDAENRLIQMENHPWLLGRTHYRLAFKYDYQGRRISKSVSSKTPDVTIFGPVAETRYLYDGWNLIGEFSVSSGGAQPALARSYAWGLDIAGSLTASGGVGALLQITDHIEGQSYFPGYDGNGNVTVLVRANDGFRAAAYEYGPFGEVLRAEGLYAAQNPFRFSTKFTDNETGLVYYGLRYYDARNGRFINRDPIEERGGLNLYGFCGNDGVNRYDVLGMSWNPLKKLVKSIKKTFKQATKWVKENWTSIVGAALAFVPGAGPLLSAAWSAGVGYHYGGVNGLAIGFAAGYAGGQIAGGLGWGSKLATNMASGGIAGGISAGVSGGNIGDGFLAGATTAGVLTAASPILQYAGRNISAGAMALGRGVRGAGIQLRNMAFDVFYPNARAEMAARTSVEFGEMIFLDDTEIATPGEGPAKSSSSGWTHEQEIAAIKEYYSKVRPPRRTGLDDLRAIGASMRDSGMGGTLKYGANEFFPAALAAGALIPAAGSLALAAPISGSLVATNSGIGYGTVASGGYGLGGVITFGQASMATGSLAASGWARGAAFGAGLYSRYQPQIDFTVGRVIDWFPNGGKTPDSWPELVVPAIQAVNSEVLNNAIPTGYASP